MPIWWPDDEIIGDKIDQAKQQWNTLTSNVQGVLQGPNLLEHARTQFDQAINPIISGLGTEVV